MSKRLDKQWIRFKEGGGNFRWPDYVIRNGLTIGGLIIFNLHNTKQVGGGGGGRRIRPLVLPSAVLRRLAIGS